MSDEHNRAGENDEGEYAEPNRPDRDGNGDIQAALPEAALIRAARVRLIEETTYRLTDLFTVVSVRIEIASEKAPAALREELAAIRKVVVHGVELNKRLFLAAQACKRETGL